jgi:hypothetical protein
MPARRDAFRGDLMESSPRVNDSTSPTSVPMRDPGVTVHRIVRDWSYADDQQLDLQPLVRAQPVRPQGAW